MKKTFLSMLFIGSGCALFAQVQQTTRDTVPTTTTTPTNTTVTPSQNSMNGSTPDDKTTLGSTGNYSAYNAVVSVPSSIQTSFTTANPGVADVRWEQNNDWYRATYTVGGRRMRMMYDMRGNSFALALPVAQGLIPDDVLEKAYTLYGDNIYDITRLKTAPVKKDLNTTTMNSSGTMNNNTSVNTTTGTATNSTTVNGTTNTTTTTPVNGTASMNNGATMNTSTMDVGGVIYQVRVIENGEVRTERMNEDGTPYTESYWRVDEQPVDNMDNQNMNQQNLNPTTDSLQQQTTDSSAHGLNDGTLNNSNSSNNNSTNTTNSDTSSPEPAAPASDSSKSDATLPSTPKMEK